MHVHVEIDPDEVLSEIDEDYIAEYLRDCGWTVIDSDLGGDAPFDTYDWILLLEIMDSLPSTVDNRRLRDKILMHRMQAK